MMPLSPGSVTERDSFWNWAHAPALYASLAFGFGIVWDYLSAIPVPCWIVLVCLFLLSALLAFGTRLSRWAGWLLIAGLLSVGGYAHSAYWESIEQHPLLSRLTEEPLMVRLRVRLLESPSYRQQTDRVFTPLWRKSGRSSFPAECMSWNDECAISGRVLVHVRGQLVGPEAGDVVDVLGTIRLPAAPRNPGEFDYRLWSFRHGILANVAAEHPRQVIVREKCPSAWWNVLPRLRARLIRILVHSLDESAEAGIASTLILGDRSHLPYDVKRSFLKSGAFHLLAISGLHIGLIALLLTRLFGMLNCSVKRSASLTIVMLMAYALLTGLRPSVLRATIFLVIYLGSQLCGRTVHRANALGLTVLILLFMNPTNLFDSGAQLSFMAVTAIFAVSPLLSRNRADRLLWARATRGVPLSRGRRVLGTLTNLLADGFLIGGAVWVFTFPIIAGSFHLFPLWGIPLTILLIPFITAALVAGWLFLVCAACLPMLLPFVEALLQGVLTVIHGIVDFAATLPGSGRNLMVTPVWWNVGYAVGIVCLLVPSFRPPHLWKMMVAWIGLHLLISHTPAGADKPTITVYSVGHGLAVLVECTDDVRLLYDCGSHDGGLVAANAILGDLSARGITHLDRVYLSHADLDHYSSLLDLNDELEIAEVVSTRALLESAESNLVYLRDSLQAAGCRLRPVAAGARETLSGNVSLEVLHPPDGVEFGSDNDASLVLYVRINGCGILLTGDLEVDGLSSLLRGVGPETDVLLSPHHGSLAANPVELSDWCRPRYVVVSSGYRAALQRLEEIYRDSERLFSTERDGAVSFTISPAGVVSAKTFRQPEATAR